MNRIASEVPNQSVAEMMSPIERLTKDLRNASVTLSDNEARFLVDSYYQMQEDRKRASNQIRSIEKSAADKQETEEPHEVLAWLAANTRSLEDQIKVALDVYSVSKDIGAWARSILGIGPVITAGLMAHIDISRAPTAGHIWSFAGLVPGVEWKKGEKRPWNASLKTLCWKIGESFVKVSGKEESLYGRLYTERKRLEWERNQRGEFEEVAQAKLARFKIGKNTDAYKWYSGMVEVVGEYDGSGKPKIKLVEEGEAIQMLPPAHIHAKAKRYAVKLFLAHYQQMAWKFEYGEEPPNPYPISILGHAHKIEPPNQRR